MIRERIRGLVAATGMSQSELARRSSVPRPNVCDFLNGKCDLNTETASRLLNVFGESAMDEKKPVEPVPESAKRRGGRPKKAEPPPVREPEKPEPTKQVEEEDGL